LTRALNRRRPFECGGGLAPAVSPKTDPFCGACRVAGQPKGKRAPAVMPTCAIRPGLPIRPPDWSVCRKGVTAAVASDSLLRSTAAVGGRSWRVCSFFQQRRRGAERRALAGYAVLRRPTPTRALPTALPSGGHCGGDAVCSVSVLRSLGQTGAGPPMVPRRA
jgi:hypothetical protein